MDTNRSWLAVCECALGIVAAGASDGPIGRQSTVEEKFVPAESDFLRRLRIIRRYDRLRILAAPEDLPVGEIGVVPTGPL